MPSIAENRTPTFQQSVIPGLPVRQYRRDPEARLKTESERSFVLKSDINDAVFRGERQFHGSNDLAFGLRELENFPYSAGAGNFIGSHVASYTGDLVRAAFVLLHGCGPLTFIAIVWALLSREFKLRHYQRSRGLDDDNVLHR